MSMRAVLRRLPFPVKQGLKYVYGAVPPRLRLGRTFWETYLFLQESQWWSRRDLEEYQMQQLTLLLEHAYQNVPYYRTVFDERGLKPKDIQSIGDLTRLPCLTKDDVRTQGRTLLATNYRPNQLVGTHTSGSTGKPLQFFQTPQTHRREWAFTCHVWSRVGYRPGDPRVELRGAIDTDNPVRFNPASHVLRLSPVVNSRETAMRYLSAMQRVKAKYLHGYPGAIASLAHAVSTYGLDVPFSLTAILFTSEAVYPWQRELVQEVFRCRTFGHYGMTEKVVLATGCEVTDHYHCVPQYGITEIDSHTREIIGTGFLNHATPFIRYRTTDVASGGSDSDQGGCAPCGRHDFPVFRDIEGRLEDFIITPGGVPVTPAIITHPFKALKTIKETQVVQEDVHHIVLRAEPWPQVSREELHQELDRLCRDLQALLSDEMRVRWVVVETIERGATGKFKWVVSHVSRDLLEKGL